MAWEQKHYPALSHGEALRRAQLDMLDNARDDDDAHPRVWAPFEVVGEPRKANWIGPQWGIGVRHGGVDCGARLFDLLVITFKLMVRVEVGRSS
jgi:hypothetical protein